MRGYALRLLFLAVATNQSFGLGWGSLVWLGGRQAEVEKPEVVEVVRWRQPVCVLPAKEVRSCLSDLSNLQKEYERSNGNEFEKEQKKLDEFVKERGSKIYENVLRDSPDLRSMYELFEQLRPSVEDIDSDEDKDHSAVKRTVPLPDEVVRGNDREAKYFVASSDKPNLIYVTKVLNAPVTATLIAHNCMPDIGIPLCEDDESQKNIQFLDDESPIEEEIDQRKLLEVISKQQSVVDFIRRMMDKPGESKNTEEKSAEAESSQTTNPNLDEDSERLEQLQLTEAFLENERNASGNSNRQKRHIKSVFLDKFKDLLNKPTNTEPIATNGPVYVTNDPMQHPWWGMLQKHYNLFKKPIFFYQKPFNHTSILEWILPKLPIEKLDFFEEMFDNIKKKKFPSTSNDPLESTNGEPEGQKPTNSEDRTSTDAVKPSEPVDGTKSNN